METKSPNAFQKHGTTYLLNAGLCLAFLLSLASLMYIVYLMLKY